MNKKFSVELTKEHFLDLLFRTRRQIQNINALEEIFENQKIINLIDKVSVESTLYFLMQYNIIYQIKGEGEELWEKIIDNDIELETIVEEYWQGFIGENKN